MTCPYQDNCMLRKEVDDAMGEIYKWCDNHSLTVDRYFVELLQERNGVEHYLSPPGRWNNYSKHLPA